MESTEFSQPISNLEVRIEPRQYHDRITIGDTGVIFNFSVKEKSLELAFTDAKEKADTNVENVTKLSLGLLGFYRWANSDQGEGIITDCESSAGNTNRKFFDTLFKLLDNGGHPELFLTYFDGTANVSAGIHAKEFADLPANDPLIIYLERIEYRSITTK